MQCGMPVRLSRHVTECSVSTCNIEPVQSSTWLFQVHFDLFPMYFNQDLYICLSASDLKFIKAVLSLTCVHALGGAVLLQQVRPGIYFKDK